MKKVLIITYYWPPAGGPGSQRVVKFVKYLPEFGWEPVILTVKKGEFPYQDRSLERDIPPEIKVYRTRSLEPFLIYKQITGKPLEEPLPVGMLIESKKGLLEKIAGWIRANLFLPDARIGWIPFAVIAGLKIIKKENIEFLFTSSPPHSLQLIGLLLKKNSGLPWVADLRDPWTGIRYYKYIRRISISRMVDGKLESEVIKNADAITSVSHSLIEEFRRKINSSLKSRLSVLTNGYDSQDFSQTKLQASDEFIILYTGNLLENQIPNALFESVSKFLKMHPEFSKKFKIRFYGKVPELLRYQIQKLEINGVVQIRQFIPHDQIVKEMEKAAILLVIIPDVENNIGIVTGKIFEYIGSGRPILLFGPTDGDAAHIIKRFPNSKVCDFGDVNGCVNFLEKMIGFWKRGKMPEIPSDLQKQFSRANLTEKLSKLFNSLV